MKWNTKYGPVAAVFCMVINTLAGWVTFFLGIVPHGGVYNSYNILYLLSSLFFLVQYLCFL